MNTTRTDQSNEDHDRIAKVLQYLEDNRDDRPSLEALAATVGLSAFHFQRLFKRWVGLSPKQFLDVLTIEHAKDLLYESQSILDTTFEVGLSSPGRLHDLFVKVEAMTPGEFKNRELGLLIQYGFHTTPFGHSLLGLTKRGICYFAFYQQGNEQEAFQQLRDAWPNAKFIQDDHETAVFVTKIFAFDQVSRDKVPVLLCGTQFQVKVWQALLRIQSGSAATYQDVAKMINKPTAYRSVANAIAANQIAYLIPCHRVVKKMGTFGGYRWGRQRKKFMLICEKSSSLSQEFKE